MLNVFDNAFILKNERLSKEYPFFISITILLVLSLIIVFSTIAYSDSIMPQAIYQNEELSFNISNDYLKEIKKVNYVTINENKYNYQITSLSSPMLDINNNIYYEIKIDVIDNTFMENEIVNLAFNYEKTNMFSKLIRILKGGLG